MSPFIISVIAYGPPREVNGSIVRSSVRLEDVFAGDDLAGFQRDPMEDSSTDIIDRVVATFQARHRCKINYDIRERTIAFDVFEPSWELAREAYLVAFELETTVLSSMMSSIISIGD